MLGPSWQQDNLLDSCIDELLGQLLGKGYRIIVRPHPEYVKRYRPRWEAIQERYASYSEDELLFEHDFSSNETVFTSDILITDWSTVAYEFSFSTCKPSIFINTTMKVNNPKWKELGIEPTDISWRDEVGVSLEPDALERFGETVASMLEQSDSWHDRIATFRNESIYNLGDSAEVAGRFLLDEVLAKQAEHEAAKTPNTTKAQDSSTKAAE